MPRVIILLAFIAALFVCLMVGVWDVVTSDRWHWLVLIIAIVFVAASIWRAASVSLV